MERITTLIGIVIPMITIAGSAFAFVWKTYRDSRESRQQVFFDLMQKIDGKGTIAEKLAAVYQLRFFPEHGEFIKRFCESQANNIEGSASAVEALRKEFQSTRDYFANR